MENRTIKLLQPGCLGSVVLTIVLASFASAGAATIPVTSIADSGPGSLRAALKGVRRKGVTH